MHSTTIINFIFAITLAVGGVAAECTQKYTIANCCYSSAAAVERQSKKFSYDASGSACASSVTLTCDADCCNLQGKGIGCPK